VDIIQFQLSEQFKDLPFKPIPAKKAFPSWITALETELQGPYSGRKTIKGCPPVTDMMSHGYLLPLWFEFYLKWNNERGVYQHQDRLSDNSFPSITYHSPDQYASKYFRGWSVFKLSSPWLIRTPPGTSVMLIPPVYRDDCPFEILPSIIDTDSYQGSFSFTCKIKVDKETTFVCEPGVPFVQIIPFKRSDWQQEISDIPQKEFLRGSNMLKYYVSSAYKKMFWKKKGFN
jgi:hypothetical protein